MSLVIGLGFRKTGSSFSEVLPVKTVRSSLVIPMGIMLIGGILAAAAVNVVVQIAIPKPSSVRGAVGSFLDAGFWSALFTVVILGPLTEEFLFRGVILRGLLRNYGRRRAILLSALLFSLFHVNPWQVSISFVLGALFAWWVVETGSLLPGILGHQVNNLSLLLLGMAGKNAMRHDQPTTVRLLLTGLALLLLGTALLGAGTWLFKRTGRLTKPPR